jgi:predicted nucleic acid-binding protein
VIYLDSNVIIRFIEIPPAGNPIKARLAGQGGFVTSQLSRLECRCLPLRAKDQQLLAAYDSFFASAELTMIEIDVAVIDRATEIRASHAAIRSPDSIHLASAIVAGAKTFLTGDVRLKQFTQIAVEII